MQESSEPTYENKVALSRGTLFPGLDLPFMNVVNDTLPATPMTEMMARIAMTMMSSMSVKPRVSAVFMTVDPFDAFYIRLVTCCAPRMVAPQQSSTPTNVGSCTVAEPEPAALSWKRRM